MSNENYYDINALTLPKDGTLSKLDTELSLVEQIIISSMITYIRNTDGGQFETGILCDISEYNEIKNDNGSFTYFDRHYKTYLEYLKRENHSWYNLISFESQFGFPEYFKTWENGESNIKLIINSPDALISLCKKGYLIDYCDQYKLTDKIILALKVYCK